MTESTQEIKVTQTSTADLFDEVETLKVKLLEAKQREELLERRLAEAAGGPVEYVGKEGQHTWEFSCEPYLRLRRHPKPGKVTLYYGAVPQYQVTNHDLVLWHPASTENDKTQAATADHCLGLAVTHGLSVGVVTHSEYTFDRLRLRTAECREYLQYIEVQFFAPLFPGSGASEPQSVDVDDRSELEWPRGFGMLGVETEVAIGYVIEERKKAEQNDGA